MREHYFALIDEADSLDDLDYICERACDEISNNDTYCAITDRATRKAQTWASGHKTPAEWDEVKDLPDDVFHGWFSAKALVEILL